MKPLKPARSTRNSTSTNVPPLADRIWIFAMPAWPKLEPCAVNPSDVACAIVHPTDSAITARARSKISSRDAEKSLCWWKCLYLKSMAASVREY
jgi:hypothetical protein